MNTAILKRFAQEARLILKAGVENRLIYWGFDRAGNSASEEPLPINGGCQFRGKIINDPTILIKWKALKEANGKNGFQTTAEEAAYTWFNRLMAIKIMAKNDYITPLLAFESDRLLTPQIITYAKRGMLTAMTADQHHRIEPYLLDDSLETELFASLITIYCQNHSLLRRVFGRLDDWTELLLPADILAENGFIRLLNTTDAITDDDYRKVELIGWLYQFYISERKEEVFRGFQNKKKAEAKDIPAATQIFTPNWIVKYMVQNTVGRLWLDLNPTSPLRSQMPYLCNNGIPAVESTDGILPSPLITSATDIKLLDPACGSGHILSEGFDLLFEMYMEEGYSKREAVRHIFTHNLYGLDIDQRAAQLANFALLMKAARHDRQTLDNDLRPQIYAMPPPYLFDEFTIAHFLGENKEYAPNLAEILHLMQQAQNLGSILKIDIPPAMRDHLQSQLTHWEKQPISDVFIKDTIARLKPYIRIILLLTQKYESVAANPPYMGSGNMNEALKVYINTHYPEGKSDLATVFIQFFKYITIKRGFYSFITPPSWMFLSTYEDLRKQIIKETSIDSLLHLSRGIFGADFGSVSTVIRNYSYPESKGVYYRLIERTFQEFDQDHLHILFLKTKENQCFRYLFSEYTKDNNEFEFNHNEKGALIYYANISQSNFEKIPGNPVAYWVSENVIKTFVNHNQLSLYADVKSGLSTGNNDLFIRAWHEISYLKIFLEKSDEYHARKDYKWIPYNKGGGIRKWYGNNELVVNWENEAKDIREMRCGTFRNPTYYFKSGITWSGMSSSYVSYRMVDLGFIFDSNKGPMIFVKNDYIDYISYCIGFLNTKISNYYISLFNPTVSTQIGDVEKIILILSEKDFSKIIFYSKDAQSISRLDWDSRETSWDFKENELIRRQAATVEEAYRSWLSEWTTQFKQLHSNEVELNRLFIEIYGLQDELTPEVKLRDITILQEELDYSALGEATETSQLSDAAALPVKPAEVIGQLLSYIVGCVMGRYRLDKSGLHIAHPNPTADETAPYDFNSKPFCIDEDAIVPLMDATCGFANNALSRIKDFIELVWGENKLTANLNFIEAALSKDLETYLMKDFWKEHCRRYQKRPVYWLFASPKGAFRALTYMHRMNRFTVEKIRSQYLLRYIRHLETRREALETDVASLDRLRQRTLEKIRQDIAECRAYDLHLKDVADHQIAFDLDDGVAVNHAKFAPVVAAI